VARDHQEICGAVWPGSLQHLRVGPGLQGFLAVFPALIALLGLIQFLHLRATAAEKLTASVDKIMPPGASGVVSQAVGSASHPSASESLTALIGGILVAL
jgi:uncharacterized BrkB/YihY/UPF0761 family membrane protein